jgi:4-amino-4-deoxy-L-arabinose transferase-like glycosyltransferase
VSGQVNRTCRTEVYQTAKSLGCYIRLVLPQQINPSNRAEPSSLLGFVRKHWRYVLLFALAGLLLRLLFYFRFPHLMGDSLVYGDIAKNWLDQGIFGLSHAEGVRPTWIRLPGYPAFLAACFALFGREHYNAVLLAQIAADLAGCLVIADIARRTVSGRAGRIAFALAALCPFTANYTVAPLAETLSIFFAALALDFAVAAFISLDEGRQNWKAWIGCGVALSAGILLRPDGGILLVCVGLFLLWRMWRLPRQRWQLFWAGALLLSVSIAPLVPWTIRNWRLFHQFEPLSPRYANDPDEFVPQGFDKWMRTWVVDYVSTEEIYWQIPGDDVDLRLLPRRACDNEQQCAETQAIFNDYSNSHFVGPELSQRFDQLASQRIRSNPFRYYVWLPVLRSADMWLRPRTEMLPISPRWWEFSEDPHDSSIATLWGVLNLLFIAAAVMAVIRGPRPRCLALMLLFILLRSAFLGTLENPEPRYTLECFPVVLVLSAAWLSARFRSATNLPGS